MRQCTCSPIPSGKLFGHLGYFKVFSKSVLMAFVTSPRSDKGRFARLEKMKNIVTCLTNGLPFSSPFTLENAKSFLLNEFLSELRDPLALPRTNRSQIAEDFEQVFARRADHFCLRRGKEFLPPKSLSTVVVRERVTTQSNPQMGIQLLIIKRLLKTAWEGAEKGSPKICLVERLLGSEDHRGLRTKLGQNELEFLELWRYSHVALWKKNSPYRIDLERLVGKRLENWMDLKEVVLPNDIPDYELTGWENCRREVQDLFSGERTLTLDRSFCITYYRMTREMSYDMRLIQKICHMRNELQLSAVVALMRQRVDEDDPKKLNCEHYEVVMDVTNAMLSTDQSSEPNLILNLLSSIASVETKSEILEEQMEKILRRYEDTDDTIYQQLGKSKQSRRLRLYRDDRDSQDLVINASKIILFFAYSTQLESVEIKMLIQTINLISSKICKDRDEKDNGRPMSDPRALERYCKNGHFGTLSILLLAWMTATDPKEGVMLLGRKRRHDGTYSYGGEGGNDLNYYPKVPLASTEPAGSHNEYDKNPCWISECEDEELCTRGQETPMIGITRLGWYLFRRFKFSKKGSAISSMEKESVFMRDHILRTRPFSFLQLLLRCYAVEHNTDRDVFVSIVYEYCSRYVGHLEDVFEYGVDLDYLTPRAELIVRLQQERTNSRSPSPHDANAYHQNIASDPTEETDCLDDFLKLIEVIVTLYPTQGRPMWLVERYVGGRNTHWRAFLHRLHSNIESATSGRFYGTLFKPFMNMLSAMSVDSEVAGCIYRLLDRGQTGEHVNSPLLCTWSSIINVLNDMLVARDSNDGKSKSRRDPSIVARVEDTDEIFQNMMTSLRFAQSILRHYPIYAKFSTKLFRLQNNSQKRFLDLLLELLMLPLKPVLKGEIMRTVAVMVQHDYQAQGKGQGVRAERSTDVWRWIAQSGILGDGTFRHYRKSEAPDQLSLRDDASREATIMREFVENECDAENYPATCGFLCLLAELMRWGSPEQLVIPTSGDSNTLTADVTQCLNGFICDQLFRQYSKLQYSSASMQCSPPTCKWELAANCLAVFYRILVSYDVGEDILPSARLHERESSSTRFICRRDRSPGHYLMSRFLTTAQSGLLDTLLELLSERELSNGIRHISHGSVEMQSAIWGERAALLGLSIIRVLLDKENVFLNCTNDKSIIKLSNRLSKHRCFHHVACYAQYVGNAEINVNAIRIVQLMSNIAGNKLKCVAPPDRSREIDGLSFSGDNLSKPFVVAFAFRLRCVDVSGELRTFRNRDLGRFTCEGNLRDTYIRSINGSASGLSHAKQMNRQWLIKRDIQLLEHSRKMILRIILADLRNSGGHNVAHVLLSLRTPVEEFASRNDSEEAQASIQNLSRGLSLQGESCFRAIKEIIDIESSLGMGELSVLCFQIFYQLCKHASTAPFIVPHLRKYCDKSEHGFWYYYAMRLGLDFKSVYKFVIDNAKFAQPIRRRMDEEMHDLPNAREGTREDGTHTDAEETRIRKAQVVVDLFRWVLSGVALDIHLALHDQPPKINHAAKLLALVCGDHIESLETQRSGNSLLKMLLPMFCVSDRTMEMPHTPVDERVNGDFIYKLAETCCVHTEASNTLEYTQINVHRLHEQLRVLFDRKVNKTAYNKHLISEFCHWALKWNQYTKNIFLRRAAILSLSVILQLAVTEKGYSALADIDGPCGRSKSENCQSFVATFLLSILRQLSFESFDPHTAQPLADAVLCLTSRLRFSSAEIVLSNDQCLRILCDIVHILMLKTTSSRMRCTLTGGLLHACKYCRILISKNVLRSGNISFGMMNMGGNLFWETGDVFVEPLEGRISQTEFAKWNNLVLRIREMFATKGDVLVNVLLRDTLSGPIGCRVTALEMLSYLLLHDRAGKWLSVIRNEGYIQFFLNIFHEVDSTSLQDNGMVKLSPIVSLFTHSMSLLLSVARTQGGAAALLEYGIVERMITCRSLIKELESANRTNMLLSTLRVLQAMFTTLPKSEDKLTKQTLSFFGVRTVNVGTGGHSTIIESILNTQRLSSLEALTEVSIATSLVLSCAYGRLEFHQRHGLTKKRMDELMMKIFFKFSRTPESVDVNRISEGWFHGVIPETLNENSDNRVYCAAPVGFRGNRWTKFNCHVWIAGRAILKHAAMYASVVIRSSPLMSEQVNINGFRRIAPLYLETADHEYDGIGHEVSHHGCSGLAKILQNVGEEAVHAVKYLTELTVLDSSANNTFPSCDGNVSHRDHTESIQVAQQHVKHILPVFEIVLGLIYTHVKHYINASNLGKYKEYVNNILTLECVKYLQISATSSDNEEDTSFRNLSSPHFISMISSCLRNAVQEW